MPDLPELRWEIRGGWDCLVLGEETIATYGGGRFARAAVEQVIENWKARRAAGETDEQIRASGGHRPTRPIPGTPEALEARLAEIEKLHPAITGSAGQEESLERRREDAALRKARIEDLVIKAVSANPALTRPGIVKWVQKQWASPDWSDEEKKIYKRTIGNTTIRKAIDRLVEAKAIKPPPRKK
jgi:hypothetical protein